MDLTADEVRIIQTMIATSDWAELLHAQLRAASVTSREWTGVGFFTNLLIGETAQRLPISKRIVIGGWGCMGGHECTFLLFTTDDGLLDFIECATFGNDHLPEAAVLEEVKADPRQNR